MNSNTSKETSREDLKELSLRTCSAIGVIRRHPPKLPGRLEHWSTSLRGGLRLVLPLVSAAWLIAAGSAARASIAYGTLNNFDCVNDTGVQAHGFDIELDDVHSKDITYTYDWNHYGVPKIAEDTTSVPGHTNVLVRYAAVKTNGVWSAYTAVPAGPIAPTQGHQFTNPSVNFGGEHFGVGFFVVPSAVKYNWLIEDGSGNLVHGPPVNVSTPTFTYNPPVAAAPANVVAVIVPPPPPVPPPLQFGEASWVKEIKTTTHNTNKVELAKLVGDDPGLPQPWANGEAPEIEIEWRVLQTEFAAANGGLNGALQGAPENLPGGDEVITRRYEFYKYTGPLDAETGQAVADTVAADGLHGAGTVTYVSGFDPATGQPVTTTVDLSTITIVGDFFGAQMSAFDVAPNLGLIDHLQDGEVNVAYPDRTVAVAGGAPFLAALKSGALPDGLKLDTVTGVLSGTPTAAGVFTFTVEASDTTGAVVSKQYTVTIAGGAAPPTFAVSTSASPANGGTTAGDGKYASGQSVTVLASPNAGYAFVNWTEGGATVSLSPSYQFTVSANRSLVANFVLITYTVATSATPNAGGTTAGAGTYNSGSSVTVTATPNAGYAFVNWTEGGVAVSVSASYQFTVSANRSLVANFVLITYTVATSATPNAGGTTAGAGTYNSGSSVTVTATPNAGYAFVNWTEGGVAVSGTASYQFTISANRSLVANFVLITYTVATSAAPSAGGTTAGAGTYNSGSSVTVTAIPNAGYAFMNWTEGGVAVSASASYQFTASANRSLVANFVLITYTVATSATPNAGGTTAGAGTYNSGSSVTVTATPNAGYRFINWTESGVEVSTSASYSFAVSANRSLVAHFTPTYTIVARPAMLWPANHRLVLVTLSLVSVDPSLRGRIVGVTMNEPPDRTQPDWKIAGDLRLWLRAERQEKGSGRIYTITVQCTDAAGYVSTGTTTVSVPRRHDD